MRLTKLPALLLAAAAFAPFSTPAETPAKPNIVYVLCDDLGYGDVHCLNPERGKIATPNADRLAAQGMIFSDAHSGSSVCTPTRYGILTGRYAWRTKLQSGVLGGESPPLIAADRLTTPALLRQHGYATACIGKWHLGTKLPDAAHLADAIAEGPTTRGFDYFFGISASLDMPPYAFIENDRYTEAPTATKQWIRKGPAAPGFEAVDVLPTLTRKAVEYIGRRAAEKQPFFLYLPLASPHTPIVPGPEWRGKSGLGSYGDFVMATDWALGQVMTALDQAGIADNTLLIFTSDNGCSPAAGVGALEKQGHFPSAELRGYKADIWEGGHRIPFIARWPGVTKPGSICRQLTCLTDLMATSAEVVGAQLPDNAGEDSFSILSLLKQPERPVREAVVHHSISGVFALRSGAAKLIFGTGSGGWSAGGKDKSPVQLYDMAKDLGELQNTQETSRADLARLTGFMEKIIADGRSTPGPPQKNDVAIKLWKNGTPPTIVPERKD
ncbi:MAG: arylsulfatase [Chthoniobacter sp.]|nr:arylsulfatase [Chthoniobacter sp.]